MSSRASHNQVYRRLGKYPQMTKSPKKSTKKVARKAASGSKKAMGATMCKSCKRAY